MEAVVESGKTVSKRADALTRGTTAKPVSRDKIIRRERSIPRVHRNKASILKAVVKFEHPRIPAFQPFMKPVSYFLRK